MQTYSFHNHVLLVSFLILVIIVPMSLIAQDVSIEDFRIPETKYQRLLGGLSGTWNKADEESINNSYGYSYYKNSNSTNSSNAQMSLDYLTSNYNEDNSFQLSLSVNGNASKSSSNSNQWNPNPTSSTSNSQNNSNFNFIPFINYSRYIIPDKWYWYTEGSGNYSYQEIRQTQTYINNGTTYDSMYNKNNNWSASLGAGFGYGKMRDGYSVYGVLRVLDKLEGDSLLIRSLTKEEILRLVNIFARRNEYTYSQERYVKYFMDDLFAELQKMGVLKNNVPLTYSVARAIEVLSEQIEPRLFGWRIQLGFQKTFDENKEYADDGFNNGNYHYYLWSSRNFARISSEYGHALSLNLHLHSILSINIPDKDYGRKIDFNFNVNGIYQIGERIDATLSYGINRTHFVNTFDQNNFSRMINSEISASFRFFIENNVSFTLSGSYLDRKQDGYMPNETTSSTNKIPRISFGVNYRFF